MLKLLLGLVVALGAFSTANAQQFIYGLCYTNAAQYEQIYVQVHGDIYKEPFLVCGYTAAQTNALRAQLKAKYGY